MEKKFGVVRNYTGVQFGELREQIDPKINALHDELSDCYYNKKPFQTYGILDKPMFDKLHGLLFIQRDVRFHAENLKQPIEKQIPENQYNEVEIAGKIEKRSDIAQAYVTDQASSGIVLVIN